MLGMDIGVVDRQASGLQHVDALHLSMHGSWPTELQRVKDQESRPRRLWRRVKGQGSRTKCLWQRGAERNVLEKANSFEEVTLSRHGGGETPPFHGYAVGDVLEWGKFF